MEDFFQLEDLLDKTIGIRPKILGFPGGSNNLVSQTTGGKKLMNSLKDALNSKGYQYFDWNVNSKHSEILYRPNLHIIKMEKKLILKKENASIRKKYILFT